MKALVPIQVLDFDDSLWVKSNRFDRMDAVSAVANEPALDRSSHGLTDNWVRGTLTSNAEVPLSAIIW